MRNIFNGFSNPLNSPTRKLHKEILKFRHSELPSEEALPSVDKVRSLIEKGANVNAVIKFKRYTALSRCANVYQTQMRYAQMTERGLMRASVNGRKITPEDRKLYANRFLEVAKVLVEAGADPRVGKIGKFNKDNNAMSWLTFDVKPALVKDFKDLLTVAEAAAIKREANKPKPPKNGPQ